MVMYSSKPMVLVEVVQWILVFYALVHDVEGHGVYPKDGVQRHPSCVSKCQQLLEKVIVAEDIEDPMASCSTALIVVLLMLGVKFQTIIVQTNCSFKCRGKERTKCILGCEIRKIGNPNAIQRLKKEAKIAALLRTKRKVEVDCPPESEAVRDPLHGVNNPDAKIRQIVYTVGSRNKTIVQVIWDPPTECMERPGVCKGYLVQWALDVIVVKYYCEIINKNVTNFILDESTGFDGAQGFAVNVKAIPYQSAGTTTYHFKTPPSPDKLAKPQILRFTSEKSTPTFTSRTTTNFTSQESLSTISTNQFFKPGERTEDQQSSTALILSLSVIAIVIIAILGLVGWKSYRWFKSKQSLDLQIDVPTRYKGTIYVSYLPEKATINHVREIYSWLKSHNIEVVMDQMYNDQKLYNSLGPKRFGEKFLTQADKVIMIVTNGYLKLCWLDDTVDIDSMPCFTSLNEERLYSEVTHIKTELSTTLKHGPIRFIPVLVNLSDDYLPLWLQKLTTVKWPEKNDGKTKTLLNLLIGNDQLDC